MSEITGSPGVVKAAAVLGLLLTAVAMYTAFALPL
jgi:succinate-acetate transporter protein